MTLQSGKKKLSKEREFLFVLTGRENRGYFIANSSKTVILFYKRKR